MRRSVVKNLIITAAVALASCGQSNLDDGTGASALRDDITAPAVNFKLGDRAEALAVGGEGYRIFLGSSAALEDRTVRFCVGALAACSASSAVFIATTPQVIQGRKIYISNEAIGLRDGLMLTAVARLADGSKVLQKTIALRPQSTNSTLPPQNSPLANPVVPVNPQQPQLLPVQPVQPQDSDCYKGEPIVCEAEKLIVEYTNAYRAQSGRAALKHHAHLAFVSRDWSEKQAKQYGMGHTGFSQGWRNEVYRREFGSMEGLSISAENVAMSGYGLTTAEKIARHFTDMWWNSAGHRANMLGGHAVLGAGVYKHGNSWYATQLFGR